MLEIEGIDSVIDMYDFLPEDINNLKNKNKIEVYFLAYPDCSLEEIKFNVIHYAKPNDWIAQCNKFDLRLVDTKSGIDRNLVLNRLLNEIDD